MRNLNKNFQLQLPQLCKGLAGYLVLLLCACGSPQMKDDKKVFRYNEASGISTLDPLYASDRAVIWAVNMLYDGLLRLDENLHLQPAIARRWMLGDDALTYTFHLRDDVRFHDHPVFPEGKGRKVISSDFFYSFQRVMDRSEGSRGNWIFNSVDKSFGNDGMLTPDDTTFIIKLNTPLPAFPEMLSMPYCCVVPKEIVNHYGKEFRSNPVGTGPFRFFKWYEGVNLVFHKNEHYFMKNHNGEALPKLDAVMISFIKDKQVAFLGFLRGEYHFQSGIDGSFKDELLNRNGGLKDKYQGKFKMLKGAYLNTEYLGMLTKEQANNPLTNRKVRQAINYAINRRELVQYLRNGIGKPAEQGFIPYGLPAFDSTRQGYSYQPQKAKELLREAGYEGKNKLQIKLSITPEYLDICEFIQQQLRAVGIQAEIDVNQPATQREMVANSKVNFFRASWIADYADAENYLALFYSKNASPAGPNYTQFNHPTYDRWYEQALRTPDAEKRKSIYARLDSIIISEAPVAVLFYDEWVRLIQNNVKNLHGNGMNLLDLRYADLD
ncbi:MAG: ABC transporter substrate-binding protein [Flavobacteriales bacterium]